MITIEFYEIYTNAQGIVFRDCWLLSENGRPQLISKDRSELEPFV